MKSSRNYVEDPVFLVDKLAHEESLLRWVEEAARGIELQVNAKKKNLFAKWVECLPMVRVTGVQSQVESY